MLLSSEPLLPEPQPSPTPTQESQAKRPLAPPSPRKGEGAAPLTTPSAAKEEGAGLAAEAAEAPPAPVAEAATAPPTPAAKAAAGPPAPAAEAAAAPPAKPVQPPAPNLAPKNGAPGRPARRAEGAEPGVNGRRIMKRPARPPVRKAALFSTQQKILAGVAAVLIAAVAIGYKPFLRYWHTKTLDEAPDLSSRKAAADALFEYWGAGILYIFEARVAKPDPLAREAAAYGMELVGRKTPAYQEVVERFKEVLPAADARGKLIFVRALANITSALIDTRGLDKPTPEQTESKAKAVKTAVEAFIPCAGAAEQNMDVRLAAVGALCGLRSEGVCKELIKLAGAETGELRIRERARAGIPATALPDAASELLAAMNGADKELSAVAKEAFIRIRDETPSRQLLPLLSDPADEIRRQIVEALGKRSNDDGAKQGISTALKDKAPEIRILALKAVPRTGISGPTSQLEALVKDSDENVRIAAAETLAELRDPESKTLLLQSFKNDLQGKTLEAYITALGKRSAGKVISEIAIVMPLLDSNPTAESSIREALVLLTRNNVPEREAQRRAWDAGRWKAWWAKFTEREKMKEAAVAEIEKIKDSGKKQDRSTYPQLKEALEKQLDVLELCKEKCKPDDLEDMEALKLLVEKYTVVKEFLIKGASYDLRK